MKRIEKYLLEGSALSVLITSIFFIFAKISSPDITPAVHIGRYFTILLFSLLIVGANLLFKIRKLAKILALLIHYVVIILAFTLIFVDLKGITGTRIFILLMLFTIFYAMMFGIVIGIRKLCSRLDSSIKTKSKQEPKKEKYKPRYK